MPSTVIRQFAYRPALEALDIEFVSGRVFRYRAVPAGVADALAQAASKGAYFNRAIRHRFGFVRLPLWEPPDEPEPVA